MRRPPIEKRFKPPEPLRLMPWQRKMRSALIRDTHDFFAVSVPRGQGKSTYIADLLAETLNPRSRLYRRGTRSILFAATVPQSKIILNMIEQRLREPNTFYITRISGRDAGFIERSCGTRIEVGAGTSGGAQGLGTNENLLIGDEVASWKKHDGDIRRQALEEALGKVGSKTKLIYISTVSPAPRNHWWPTLLESPPSYCWTYVLKESAEPDSWKSWRHVLSVNPLARREPRAKRKLRERYERALSDPVYAETFRSYRMNAGTSGTSRDFIDADEWSKVLKRKLAPRDETCCIGLDVGATNNWTSATAVWSTGRVESIALTGRKYDLVEQERMCHVNTRTFQRLHQSGHLLVDDERSIPRLELLLPWIEERRPLSIICDRFRYPDALDIFGDLFPVEERMSMWSASTADIEATQTFLEQRASLAPGARELLTLALSASYLHSDPSQPEFVKLAKVEGKSARNDSLDALIRGCGGLKRIERLGVVSEEWLVI